MIFLLFYLCNSISINYIPKTKSPPSPRFYSLMDHMTSRSSLIVFGGSNGASNFNDLWEFSLTSMTWSEIVPLSVEIPCSF